jgi:hypothetical protein
VNSFFSTEQVDIDGNQNKYYSNSYAPILSLFNGW